MNKATPYIYWTATVLVVAIMCYSAQMYFFNTATIKEIFVAYNYPDYLVIPLAIAKVLGVIIILWRPVRWITEWAYAGFFFDLLLAVTGHYMASDGSWLFPLIGIVLLLTSYVLGNKARRNYAFPSTSSAHRAKA